MFGFPSEIPFNFTTKSARWARLFHCAPVNKSPACPGRYMGLGGGGDRQQVASGLCFKAKLSTKPLTWKFFFLKQITLIFSRKVLYSSCLHLAWFWKWNFLELGIGLLTSPHCLRCKMLRTTRPLMGCVAGVKRGKGWGKWGAREIPLAPSSCVPRAPRVPEFPHPFSL